MESFIMKKHNFKRYSSLYLAFSKAFILKVNIEPIVNFFPCIIMAVWQNFFSCFITNSETFFILFTQIKFLFVDLKSEIVKEIQEILCDIEKQCKLIIIPQKIRWNIARFCGLTPSSFNWKSSIEDSFVTGEKKSIKKSSLENMF